MWWTTIRETFLRIAASGMLPARLFLPNVPESSSLPARTGPLSIELVSHCWKYDHLLVYQLSSLVAFPPSEGSVRMTVFYSPEDQGTAALLAYFGGMKVPRVEWNWQPLEKPRLMRRAIGRSLAARATQADWIWFTDCDVVFEDGCLDGLMQALQGRRESLVFPAQEYCTSLLADEHPLLQAAAAGPRLVAIDRSEFTPRSCTEAKGPLQITHGDVARATGYCDPLAVYHEPMERWRKCHEDRAFRWLLRTNGTAINVPAVYRLRHVSKGRYEGNRALGRIRGAIRQLTSSMNERRSGVRPGSR